MNIKALSVAAMLCLATPLHAQTADDAIQAYRDGDYAQALAISRPLANSGDAVALNMMGILYENGLGVPADGFRAASYYQGAADQDLPQALNNLADHYLDGWDGQEPRPDLAIPLLLRAEGMGYAGVYNNLGVSYFEGHFGTPDSRRAMEYFRRSHEAGYVDGTANVAWMYAHGEGVAEDQIEARRYYVLAHENDGPLWALENLADMWREGEGGPVDLSQAVALYEEAAERGSAYGANWLGYYYDNGEGGLPVDYERAVAYFQLAAEQGSTTGYYNLGSMYEGGRGVEEDAEMARHYYQLAADQGDAEAAYELAIMYWHGQLGYVDEIEARRMMELAVDREAELAFGDLGLMLRNGVGGGRDLLRAAEMFERGLAENDSLAFVNMGEVVSDPAFPDHDPVRGLALCLRAVEITTNEERQAQYVRRCNRLARVLSPAQQSDARAMVGSL
ncbi:SEL1-like repeat protein [Nioella aestuarii]|uniref:SEL1-like repeat protein n=1 Tax=Nioella aestuarii TaxID=1662864 RepID=UPI003D7F6FE5